MDSFVASEKEEKLLKILNGFVDCFESRNPDTGLNPESQKKCRRFYDVAGRRDGHNYRRIFSLLIKKAETQANGSLFVLKTLTAFFDMIKLLEIDEIHKLYILNYCWNLFDDNILDTVVVPQVLQLFTDKAKELTLDGQNKLLHKAMDMVKCGELVTHRAMKFLIFIANCTGNKGEVKSLKEFYLKLLQECHRDATNAVVEVIRDDEEFYVFHTFAENFLKNDLCGSVEQQKLGFAKINTFWRDFSESEVHDIVAALCDKWAENAADFYCELDTEIEEFVNVLHIFPAVSKAIIKFFKKNNLVKSSIFAIIIHLGLSSSHRYVNDVGRNLAIMMVKLWKYADELKSDGFIREVIQDLKLNKFKDKLKIVLDIIQTSKILSKSLGKGLMTLAFNLIEMGSKKTNLKVLNGRLEEPANNIAFVGRWILVETVLSNSDMAGMNFGLIVDFMIAHNTNSSTVYIILDALIQLRKQMKNEMLENWIIFEKLTSEICTLPSDVGVKMMSTLMPIINQQEDLRSKIYEDLRIKMLRPQMVETILPVVFMLLRSIAQQPATQTAFQCSQSFATLSSQTMNGFAPCKDVKMATQIFSCIKRCLHQSPITKCLVYRQTVELCKKNNHFAVQGLDMLTEEIKELPTLSMEKYIQRTTNDGDVLKFLPPYLLKASSTLLTMLLHLKENAPQTSTQIIYNGDTIARKADELIEIYMDGALAISLEDLKLTEDHDQLMKGTSNGSCYRLFGIMLIDLYDVMVEHYLTSKKITEDLSVLRKIYDILSKRKRLSQLLEKAKVKNSKEIEIKRLSNIGLGDLQIDMPVLSIMLKESQHDVVKNFDAEGTPLENILFEWIMLRIHDAASALNVSTSTSIASMESLTNMACELIYFFLTSNDGDEIGIELKKMWIIARTRAIDAFSMILRYLLTKYETKCVPSLERICEKMEEEDEPNDYARQHTQGLENAVRETPLRTQADNANDPGYNRSFRRISAKILGNIYEQIIPALVAAKHTFDLAKCHYEYQKQMMTSIAIGKKLASMFTSTADVSKMKVFKVMNELAMKHDFGEKWSTLDYFKAMMELIIKSNCSEGWTTELGKITEEIVLMFDANNESPPVYASLKPELKNQFVVLIVQTLTQLYQKVQTIIEIKLGMNDEITDEFMTKICTTMRFITQVAAKVFDIDKSLLEEDEAVITNVVNMLSVLYATMTVVTKRFNVLMNSKIPLDDWESLQILSNLSGNEINTIVNATKGNFGTKKYIVPEKKKKTTKSNDSKMIETKAKRDEKLFSKYEKDLESYAVELILLSEKYGTEDRPLKLPANENRANRDFQLSTTTGTKRKQGPEFLESSSSDSSDSEIEVD